MPLCALSPDSLKTLLSWPRCLQLVALNTAMEVLYIDISGYKLHPLKGDRKGIWSITVSGNWRLTFEFRDGHAYLLEYEDYH